MALVRLEFELDSEVYPELHAALTALRSTRARGERMRQLAAAGLVWENVRIHGAAAIGPNALAAVPPDVAAPPVGVLAGPAPRTERAPAPDRRTGPRSRATPERLPPERATPLRGADFIDLAIDAEPDVSAEERAAPAVVPLPPRTPPAVRAAAVDAGADADPPVPERRRAPRARARAVEPVVLPVLMDIVTDADAAAELAEARHAVPARVAPPTARDTVLPDDVRDDVVAASDDAVHLTSLAQKPATRSRLMRMKDKGLFRNG